MKKLILLLAVSATVSCRQKPETTALDKAEESKKIEAILDSVHLAAAKADFDGYFSHYSDNSAFLGTDATENWQLDNFKTWSKPYFDKGKAWAFTSLEKNIYFSNDGSIAWFDELLNTQMKICRGSGVFEKEGDKWKLKHYVLSMTVPNDSVGAAIKIKPPVEDAII